MKQQRSKFKPDEVPETDEILDDRELGLEGFASEWDLQLFREAQVWFFFHLLDLEKNSWNHISKKSPKLKCFGSKIEKKSAISNVCLDGSTITSKTKINGCWIYFFITPLAPSRGTPLNFFFQKTLILGYEANGALSDIKLHLFWRFFCGF